MNLSDSGPTDSILKAVLSFFGVIAAFKIVPKAFSFVTRKFVFGLVSQVVWIVIAGLLTEKAAEKFAGKDLPEASTDRP